MAREITVVQAMEVVRRAFPTRVTYGIKRTGRNTMGDCFRARLDGPKGPVVSVQFVDGMDRVDLYGIGIKAMTINVEGVE
jgi:hypothetical protein